MAPRIAIYISAVNRELGDARRVVEDVLTGFGYEAVWEDGSWPEDRREALRRKIDACAAVIQIVGRCYGDEPPEPDETWGRVSYAQYESLYARQCEKKVWFVFVDPSFNEPTVVESSEPAALQEEYVSQLRGAQPALTVVRDMEELREAVRGFEPELALLTAPSESPGMPPDPAGQAISPQDSAATDSTAAQAPQPFDDDVQFTVYRPFTMSINGSWCTWLAFVHRGGRTADDRDIVAEVEAQAQAILRESFGEYTTARQDSLCELPHAGTVTVIPQVQGLEFNPPQRSFIWQGPAHREDFLARNISPSTGIRRGKITFYIGALIAAEVNVTVNMTAAQLVRSSRKPKAEHARPYRQIFASYSRADSAIVEHLENVARTWGDSYFRDVHSIRTGEKWSTAVETLIRKADVFQLFWSSNSMRSRYVRQEWEYALSLRRRFFVRPTYWEHPMPADPSAGLPPDSLRSLHFVSLSPQALSPLDGSKPSAPGEETSGFDEGASAPEVVEESPKAPPGETPPLAPRGRGGSRRLSAEGLLPGSPGSGKTHGDDIVEEEAELARQRARLAAEIEQRKTASGARPEPVAEPASPPKAESPRPGRSRPAKPRETVLDQKARAIAEEQAKVDAEIARYQKHIEDAPKIAPELAEKRRAELIQRASRTEARPGSRPVYREGELEVKVSPSRARRLRSERSSGCARSGFMMMSLLILMGMLFHMIWKGIEADEADARRAREGDRTPAAAVWSAPRREAPPAVPASLRRAPAPDLSEQAETRFHAGEYGLAEKIAAEAAEQALTADELAEAIAALDLAGVSAESQMYAEPVEYFDLTSGAQSDEAGLADALRLDHFRSSFSRALDYYDRAAMLTDEDERPTEWAGIQSRLASAYADVKRHGHAERIYRGIVETGLRLLGVEHETTLETRVALADVLFAQNRLAEAEGECRLVLAARERTLGSDDPLTLEIRETLKEIHTAQGKGTEVDDAKPAPILDDQKEVALADRLEGQGRYSEAVKVSREVLAARRHTLGPAHSDTVDAQCALARILLKRGNYAEAVAVITPALSTMNRIFDPRSIPVILGRDTYAEALRGMGRLDEAESEHRAVVAIAEQELGRESYPTLTSCLHLALTLEAQEKFVHALTYALRAEAGFRTLSGADSEEAQLATSLRERLEQPAR